MSHSLITTRDHLADLHKKAQRVADPTASDVRTLADDMMRIMHTEKGIGLAAPQLAVLQRIVVFALDIHGNHTKQPLICINPVITKASRDLIMTEEGCLSIPGEFFPVVRSEKVSVRYYDLSGTRHTLHADHLLAIALQHEIDHLDGILMTDRYVQQTNLRAQFNEIDEPTNITHRIG